MVSYIFYFSILAVAVTKQLTTDGSILSKELFYVSRFE
jgi:hypothetical protein